MKGKYKAFLFSMKITYYTLNIQHADKLPIWYVHFVREKIFSKPIFFLNVQEGVSWTCISCISAHKTNSFSSCEAVNEILTELLVI